MKHKNRPLAGLAIVVTGFLAALAASSPARADQIYTLTTANISAPSPFGTVDVSLLNSTEALITFTSNTANGIYFLSDGSVGVNSNGSATISNITGNSAGGNSAYSDGGSGNEDGFGKFSNTINTFDGFTDRSSIISFDLTLTSGTWASAASVLTDNADGNLAAAHFGVCDSATHCTKFTDTGFAVDGTTTTVPEPASLVIFGTALASLGLIRRRRNSV